MFFKYETLDLEKEGYYFVFLELFIISGWFSKFKNI